MASNWAIVIGINEYQHHPERRLNYAVNDAQKIGNFLSHQGGFGETHVIPYLGDEAHRDNSTYPTCSNLLRLLKRDLQPNRLGKVDRLWFYFSGHGVSFNGRDYLITSDCLEDEIERFALPIDEVIAALRSHQDADIVLILDACRRHQVLGKKSFDSSIGRETIKSAKERGITTIFSCDYGQYSYELEALQQGAFTYALIEGLSQHTLPNQLENYLQQRVPALHLQHRRDQVEQTPRIRIEPASKAFQPLLPDAVTQTDIKVLVNWAKEAELEEDFETAKKLWWQVIDVSPSNTQRREARTEIERIDRKITHRGSDLSTLPKPEQHRPLIAPQSEPPQTSESSKASLNPTVTPKKDIAERSTRTTPVVPVPPARPSPVPVPRSQPSSRNTRPNQPSASRLLTRQHFLKWAIPAGMGVVGVTVASQFLGNQSQTAIDYSRLEGFLKAGKWKDADRETTNLMLKAANQEQASYLDSDSIKNFPCEVLSQINRLWVYNSRERFGFSIQKKIYVESCDGKLDDQKAWNWLYDQKALDCFGDKLGWRVKTEWISYEKLTFNPQEARQGHLPSWSNLVFRRRDVGRWEPPPNREDAFSSLVQKLVKCSI